MQHLYPNFYSLVSASSNPLDPRTRRRSCIWTCSEPSSVVNHLRNPTKEMHSLSDSLSVSSQSTVMTQPVRRRSASQAPSRNTIGHVPAQRCSLVLPQAPIEVSVTSSSAESSTPSPPSAFADNSSKDQGPVFVQTKLDRSNSTSSYGCGPKVRQQHLTARCQPVHPNISQSRECVIMSPHLPFRFPAQTFLSRRGTSNTSTSSCLQDYGRLNENQLRHSQTYERTMIMPANQHVQHPFPPTLQPALSLQSLNRVCEFSPCAIPNNQSRASRTKLVMGLRDLGTVTRQQPVSSPPQELGYLPSNVVTSAYPSHPAVINPGCLVMTHSNHARIHSSPAHLVPNRSAASPVPITLTQSRLACRQSDSNKRARYADRRRTMWGIPYTDGFQQNGCTLVPLIQHTDPSFQPVILYPTSIPHTSGRVAVSCVPNSLHQPSNDVMDATGLQSLSSDSGVDLMDSEQWRSETSNNVGGQVIKNGRRTRPVNAKRAQVVSAFEQSLNSISQRLKNLTTTTARKDSELHELRATIDALRCQSGFNLGNLSIHSLIAPGTPALTNGTQFRPTVPQTLEQHTHQATPAHVPSTDEPINKQQTGDGKSGEGSHRKGSWFRGSIGKAFRKKSSLPPTKPATISVHDAVQTTSSTQSSTGVTYSEASVTQVNLNPLSNVLNPKCPSEPITASIGSQVHMPQGNRLPLNGLSPSNSSTSNSSWSTSGINPQQDLWRNSGGKSSFAATMPNDRTFNLSNGTNGPSQTPNCSRHTIVPPYLHESNQTVESESPYSFTESQSEKASLETCAKDGSTILQTDHSRWFGPAMDETISDLSSTDPAIAAKLQAELKRLRHQLSERDMKLTDVQLEALASTHQVNQLRDQLTRLYAEMQHLRSDNARLQQMMTTPTSSTSTNAEAKPVEEPGCCTNNAGSGVNDTTWISNSEFDLFAGSIQEFRTPGRGTLSLDNSLCAKLKISTDDTKQLNLGLIYLSTFDSWAALDSHLERLYRQYVSRIDPQDRLSILDEGIVMYKVQSDSISHEHRITGSEELQGESDNFQSIMQSLPFGAIEVLLEMRTHPSGYTASMSVTSLLPRPIVEAYLEFLEEHHCLVLCVDKETGKELAAVLLSCLKRIGRITEEHYINMDGGNQAVDKLKTCLNTFREVGVTNRQWNDVGKAIVIDRMEDVMTVVEFQECLQQAGWNSVNSTENGEKNRTYIIALSNPKPPPINSTPVVQNSLPNAKVYLSPVGHCWICAEQQNYEQLNYVVRQSLKQRLIHLLVDQTINKEAGQEREHIAFMQRLTGWLEEVWNRVNHAVMKSYPNNAVSGFLSPKIFEDLPLTNTEDWFVESWNSRIIEKVCELHGSRKNIQPDEDPKNWVLSNWPWSTLSSSEENKSRFLLPLFPQQD